MAMLAEKKRREKWSLNPRGKAWSDDQNKFGQKLMEKMGWKAGEGLGANSQGVTDIVKTKVKNDSKGLGFKDKGEEWLKTTSEFDSLLEELASSQGEEGEESQTESPVSLEDRSKKSRARVHYHKFTRGKDLSRYSEKDLASIIGPDVIKIKNEQDSAADYTKNQVNRGNLEEYFNKKLKSKDRKSACNHDNDDTCNEKECKINLMGETTCLNGSQESSEIDLNSISNNKKKRKNISLDEDEIMKNNDFDSKNCEGEDEICNLESEAPNKKKKKRKPTIGLEDNLQELVENIFSDQGENENNTKLQKHDVSQNVVSRKRKNKEVVNPQEIVISSNLEKTVDNTANNDESIHSKKRRKVKDEKSRELDNREESSNISQDVTEHSLIDEEIESKKKKKKSKVKSEQQELEHIEKLDEFVNSELVANEDSKSKRKKSKSINVEPIDSSGGTTHQEVISADVIEESLGIVETQIKKKRNKSKEIDIKHQEQEAVENETIKEKKKTKHIKNEDQIKQEDEEEAFENETVKEKKKTKHIKIEKQIKQEDDETEYGDEQATSSNNAGEFLEVLGRITRLKNIKSLPKKTNDSYQTEEFMSISNVNTSHFGLSAPTDVNDNTLLLKHEPVVKDEVDSDPQAVVKNEENADMKTTKGSKRKSKKKNEKNKRQTIVSEDSTSVKCYADLKSDNKNMPKHVVSYEYNLVSAQLKEFKITPPAVKVVILEDNNSINKNTHRKLKQMEKTKYLKTLLPPDAVSKIETQVSKFHEGLKPKIEIVETMDKLEENIFDIGKSLEGNSDSIANKNESDVIKEQYSGKSEVLASLLQKTEKLIESFQKATSETNNVLDEKEKSSVANYPVEGNESKCKWLNKVEDRLVTLKSYMKMLSEGQKLPEELKPTKGLQQQNTAKKKEKAYTKANAYTNYNQDSSYSRGRLAHNVRTQRGRGVGRGQARQSAFSQTGWNKSYGAEEQEQWSESQNYGREFGDNGYSARGGRIARNTRSQRGSGRGVGRGRGVISNAIPQGGWGILKSYGTGEQEQWNESQNYEGEFGDEGFMEQRNSTGTRGFNSRGGMGGQRGVYGRGRGDSRGRGRGDFMGRGRGDFMGRGRGDFMGRGRGDFMGRGRGDFMGRGRGYFMGRGRGDFMGRGRGDFMGRGRSGFRGRGRGDVRGRGRISQTNFDAKLYAEKCKELNKVPDVCFNGVNLTFISGYAANVNAESSTNESKSLATSKIVTKQESAPAVNVAS